MEGLRAEATTRADLGREGPSSVSVDGFGEDLRELGVVAPDKAELRGSDHPLRVLVFPHQPVAGRERKLPDKFALRSAIAFPKWMNGVDFAEIIRGARGPVVCVEILQPALSGEFSEEGVKVLFHVLRGRKPNARFGNVYNTKASCPAIDILKDMSMDRFQVLGVETSDKRVLL
jgi:hypothetical protein